MISYPNAKINLGLNVLRKQSDGFHDIESVFYPVPWRDILEIVPAKEGRGEVTFTFSGLDIPSGGNPNLCERVYKLMHDEFGLPSIKMHLHKIVPIGAGLGGGSADAAFAATMLNELFVLKLTTDKLEQIVAEVGSDCSFFIRNKAAYVTGRGEVLEAFDLELSGCWIMLINPKLHIGTKDAYAGVKPVQGRDSLQNSLQQEMSEWKGSVENDFEKSVFPKHPIIADIKEDLYAKGAKYASMTGSGSTVFGLFDQEPKWEHKKGLEVKIAQL